MPKRLGRVARAFRVRDQSPDSLGLGVALNLDFDRDLVKPRRRVVDAVLQGYAVRLAHAGTAQDHDDARSGGQQQAD
jgi:hypothetical protein